MLADGKPQYKVVIILSYKEELHTGTSSESHKPLYHRVINKY